MEKYFDYAAATPLDIDIEQTMRPYYSMDFYNPSSIYGGGKRVRQVLDSARRKVAESLGAKPVEIVFTSSCTEANNLAIHGIMTQYPTCKILYSSLEHDAVRRPAEKYNSQVVPVNSIGVIDLEDLRALVENDVVMVSVMYVNNEVGSVQPIRKIAKIIEQVRTERGTGGLPLYLHVDAAQAPNLHTVSIEALGVDMMSLSGAKIYGPKGVGCLYVSKDIALEPQLLGGGQERGLRSGTENVSSIVGFSEALARATEGYKHEKDRLLECNRHLARGLVGLGGKLIVPDTISITSVSFEGCDNEYLVYALDSLGYSVASGSACHASTDEPSHVLVAMGLSDVEAKTVLRLSLGRHSSISTVDNFIRDLKVVLANA